MSWDQGSLRILAVMHWRILQSCCKCSWSVGKGCNVDYADSLLAQSSVQQDSWIHNGYLGPARVVVCRSQGRSTRFVGIGDFPQRVSMI